MNWFLIPHLQLHHITEHQMHCVEVEGKPIIITKRNDELHAFTALCPHAGAALKDGFIDAFGCVVCPLHGYRYDVRNGYNKSGEGYKLKTYPLKIEGQNIFVSLQP